MSLCIQDTIPIYRISQGGIFDLKTKIKHWVQRKEYTCEKEATGAKFESLLRSMNVSYKIIVSNHYADNDLLREAILHKAVNKEMEPLAQEYHKLLEERLAEGRSGLL